MALITFNPGVQSISGHVGGFVYKPQQGRNVLAKKAERNPPRNSPDQLAQQGLFKQATEYAKTVKYKPEPLAAYKLIARKLQTDWFAMAISDWMNAPQVTAIILSAYSQHAGDIIWVQAGKKIGKTTATAPIAAVTVAIEDGAHNPVESGAAVLDSAGGMWKYTTTADASGQTGLIVSATATDRPGHTGTLSVTR